MAITRALLVGLAAGAVATYAKTKAEEVLQPLAEKAVPPGVGEKAGIGADPAGHPENMPPSEVVDRVQQAVTGEPLDDEQREKASAPVHWATGLGFGVAYSVAATRVPQVRAGYGLVAASGLFLATHVTALPALGVQHSPTRLPKAWWLWEGGSHLVFGAVLDAGMRVVSLALPERGHRD